MKRTVIFISDKEGHALKKLEVDRFYYDSEREELITYRGSKRDKWFVIAVHLLEMDEYNDIYDAIVNL